LKKPIRSLAGYAIASSVLLAGAVMVLLATARTSSAARRVTGAGATFPYPIYSKWFDEYHKLHPDIEFNYQSIGSGGGIRQVTDGTVDFGATDGPMTDEQIKAYDPPICQPHSSGRPYQVHGVRIWSTHLVRRQHHESMPLLAVDSFELSTTGV
jgi:ABC-type phosphate transport system substrate-binding protein